MNFAEAFIQYNVQIGPVEMTAKDHDLINFSGQAHMKIKNDILNLVGLVSSINGLSDFI